MLTMSGGLLLEATEADTETAGPIAVVQLELL